MMPMFDSRSASTRGFTLIELMITLVILASIGIALGVALDGFLGWTAVGRAKDEIAVDAQNVWNVLNDDLSQSAWYRPDSTVSFNVAMLADRGLFYCPYVVQAAHATGQVGGAPTVGNSLLYPFARANTGSITYAIDPLLAANDAVLPGTVADFVGGPGTTAAANDAYRASFFARSQELVFVRTTTSIWNANTDRPLVSGDAAPHPPVPLERFQGTASDWRTAANHASIGVLFPSGWKRTGSTWTQHTPNLPYGRVMDSTLLSATAGVSDFQTQFEQYAQPDFQTQLTENVRLFGYLVVPCPRQEGLGRLVRVRTMRTGATLPSFGVNPGQRISMSTDGSTMVVVDRVLSDNVVRVLFETSRHACAPGTLPMARSQIGANNIRATIFFARLAEHRRPQAPLIYQAITMVFCMRASNTVQDQFAARSLMTRLPFTY